MRIEGIAARGRGEYQKHLDGKRLSRGQAGLAKCYECMGGYCDGKADCGISKCPLYPYMPYRAKKADKPPEAIENTPRKRGRPKKQI